MCGIWLQVILFTLLFYAKSESIHLNGKEIESFFDSQLTEDYRKEYGISSLAVSITQGNETVFFKGYGYQNPSSKQPVTSKTIYGLASISKTFIAVSTVQLFSKDQYSESIDDFLTDIKVPDIIHGDYYSSFGGYPHVKSLRDVQIWNLLTHTEGMDIPVALSHRKKPKTLLEDLQLHLPPRIRQTNLVSTYSNAGAALLGLIVEQNNPKKLDYGQYIKSSIFDPLGMKNTYYGYDEAKKNDPTDLCVLTYLSDDGDYVTYDHFLGDDISYQPAGIVYSSSEDMQEYSKSLLLQKNEYFLSDEQHNNLFDPLYIPNGDVIIGNNDDSSFEYLEFEDSISSIFYTKNIGPVGWIGHDGDLPPFHSQMMLNFEHNVSFILLYTASDGSFRDTLRRDFSHHFIYTNETIDEWCPNFNNNTPISTTEKELYEKKSGCCRRTFSLQNDFSRSDDQLAKLKKKYEDEYVGCYLGFRFSHTSFITTLSELSLLRSSQYLCLELIDDGKYLGIKQEDEDGQYPFTMYSSENKQDIIFLEMNNEYDDDDVTNFLITQRRGEDTVELILGDTDPPIASFVRNDEDEIRYLVLYNIYNTLEFYGSKKQLFWKIHFLYALYTFTPVLGLLIIFGCCCCICCGFVICCCDRMVCQQVWIYLRNRRRRGIPLIGSKNSINSYDLYFWKKNINQEYDMIGGSNGGISGAGGITSSRRRKRGNKISSNRGSGILFGGLVDYYDDDGDQNSSFWRRFTNTLVNFCFEVNSCCCVQGCFLVCIICVIGFNILHYLFMYIMGYLWLFPKNGYLPELVEIGSYMPIVSVVFLAVLVCCCCCSFCCFGCGGWENLSKGVVFRKWRRRRGGDLSLRRMMCDNLPYHRYVHYGCLCCCACLVVFPAVLYYVLAGYFSSFAFVDLLKSN